MNTKRWLWASAAVLGIGFVMGFVVHQVLLADLYKQTASLWRPEADMNRMMWIMWIGSIIHALMFTFIYAKGIEKKKNKFDQGVRYGVYIFLLTCLPMSLSWYVILPIPGVLAVYWAVAGLVQSVASGAAVASIYKA